MTHLKTMGTDIEFPVHNGSSFVSIEGMLGGSKDEPRLVDRGNLQEDNVMAEVAVDYATSKPEFIGNIQTVLGQLDTELSKYQVKRHTVSSVVFDKTHLQTRQAKTFGCDPDKNGWTYQDNPRPDAHEVPGLRTAGGHIHLGFDFEEDSYDRSFVTQWLDVYLGLPSIFLDDDDQRRILYGKAGSHRIKPYGVEYRTLSNFWVKNNNLIEWVWDASEVALSKYFSEGPLYEDEHLAHQIQQAINNSSKGLAVNLMKRFNVEVPHA